MVVDEFAFESADTRLKVFDFVFVEPFKFGEASIYVGTSACAAAGSLNFFEITTPAMRALMPAKTTKVMMTAFQNSFFSPASSA